MVGLVLLILGTALAMGAVHPWPYSVAEAVIFILVAVALLKVWWMKLEVAALWDSDFRALIVPLMLFIVFALCQLLPLPPQVLRLISPTTYEIYARAFRGGHFIVWVMAR